MDSVTLSDNALLREYKQGNPQAFRGLVDRYAAPIYNLAYRLLRDPMEAENVTQEAFLRVLTSIDRIRPDSSIKPYLFRIALNLCRDTVRRKRPLVFTDLDSSSQDYGESLSEAIPDDQPALWEQLADEELQAQLYQAIDDLAPPYQTVILLRYVEDFSYEDIAQTLAVPLNTVRTHLYRAKRLLRLSLEQDSTIHQPTSLTNRSTD